MSYGYYDALVATILSIILVVAIIMLILSVLMIVGTWKLFEKAGEDGWKSLIPFLNTYILFKLTWGNGIYFLFLWIPFVNIVVSVITYYKLAKVFGYGLAYTIGLLFVPWIFMLILGFNSAEYLGCDRDKVQDLQ